MSSISFDELDGFEMVEFEVLVLVTEQLVVVLEKLHLFEAIYVELSDEGVKVIMLVEGRQYFHREFLWRINVEAIAF